MLVDPSARAEAEPQATQLEEIVVTGTYLRGADSPSPVTVITQDDIARQGRATVAETLAALPQNFTGAAYEGSAGTGADRTSRNSAYATGVNLRGLGEHQASILVHGDTPTALAEHLSKARAILADSGLVVAREDLGLEAAFWSQFPGAFARRTRPAAITSRNFAALAPFHAHPVGKAHGNHWGEAVAVLRTTAGSPFWFHFHVGDLGHTFICGPSGSGKTVVQNFMLAQLERFDAQQLFIDKDRGAEIFVRACGGTYLALRNGEPTGFAPFKALDPSPANRAFLVRLVRALVARPNETLTVPEARAIDQGVAALEALPRERRHRRPAQPPRSGRRRRRGRSAGALAKGRPARLGARQR